MQAIVEPGKISGSITVPPSKSITQRICAAAMLHKSKTIISNAGNSDDEQAALKILEQLGATLTHSDDGVITVTNTGISPKEYTINCGESGLSSRLFIPIAALSSEEITITGAGSLLNRPVTEYVKILPELGVAVKADSTTLPITVKGPLQPKDITIDGSLSSQFLSGLLITYAFTVTKPTTITVNNLNSKPYIDLTLNVLANFGKVVTHEDYKAFTVTPLEEADIDVFAAIEGDWSSAATLLVAGALNGEITVEGIDTNSLQADKKILDILKDAGAELIIEPYKVTVKEPDELQAFNYDATDSPDLFPVLAVLAGACKGESTIKGIARLLHKESNRLESITDLLDKFNIFHSVHDDELVIEGKEVFDYAQINSYNDHRIVMAATIGAMRAKGRTTIHGMEAVNKSYPDFFAHLSSVGADIITNLE